LRNSPPPLAQLMRAPQRRTASCGGGHPQLASLAPRACCCGGGAAAAPGAAAAAARARLRGALPAHFRTRAVRRSFAISHLRMTCTRAPRC